MHFIYVLSLFACVALGFLAGTSFTQAQQAYMDSEAALLAAEQAGREQMADTISKAVIPDIPENLK